MVKDGRGFRTRVTPIGTKQDDGTVLVQTVSITRSTDKNGVVVSGQPLPLNEFVSETLETRSHWPNIVLGRALAGF